MCPVHCDYRQIILPPSSVITSKAANGYHFKTGQTRRHPGATSMFYSARCCSRKSN